MRFEEFIAHLEEHKNPACYIYHREQSKVSVVIQPELLVFNNHHLLRSLFSFFPTHKENLIIYLQTHQEPKKFYEINSENFQRHANNIWRSDLSEVEYIFYKKPALYLSILSTQSKEIISQNRESYLARTQATILTFYENLKVLSQNELMNVADYFYCLDYLRTAQQADASNPLRAKRIQDRLNGIELLLLRILIKHDAIELLFARYTDEKIFSLIANLDKAPHYLFHHAFEIGTEKGIRTLLNCYKQSPTTLYDKFNQSFLHVANDNCLALAHQYTPDMHHLDAADQTALHHCRLLKNHAKARFLLLKGADPYKHGPKTIHFWHDDPSLNLQTYFLFQREGRVINLPIDTLPQRGPYCGSTAIAGTVNFSKERYPFLFQDTTFISAKKSDTNPRSTTSVSAIAKLLGATTHGPIFSVKKMIEIIKQLECNAMSFDVNDQSEFYEIIKKSINFNHPLIILFSSYKNGNPEKEPSAIHAHWAIIIGYRQTPTGLQILLAQHGKFDRTDGEELFHQFFNMNPTLPTSYLYKSDKRSWIFSKELPKQVDNILEKVIIPETNLKDDFIRKLIVVAPPHYNFEQLKLLIELSKTPQYKRLSR